MDGKTILIVDDEADIRLNLETALSAEGYRAILASSGAEALHLARSMAPDIALLDIMMPDMDGYELCKKIKAGESGGRGPMIVFASALRKTKNKVEGLDLGADDYVTKPFNMPELLAKIRALLRVREGNQRLERLVNFSRAVNALELTAIAKAVAEGIPGLLQTDRFSLFMIDWEANAFKMISHNHAEKEMDDFFIPMASSPLMLETVKKGSEIVITDFPSSKYSSGAARGKYTDGHALCAPVGLGRETFGVLNLNGNSRGFFDRLDATFIRLVEEALAASLGNHLHHEEINRLAITDGLTRLFNHRHFHERLAQEFERAKRFNQDLSLILTDIDFFKRINDTYGHPVGDVVLKTVAGRIAGHLRKIDLTARYGGEEFALLLPQTSLDMAVAVAERIREDMAAHPVETEKGSLTVTISLGVCDTSLSGITRGADLVRKADEALYAAKKEGRNRTKAAI